MLAVNDFHLIGLVPMGHQRMWRGEGPYRSEVTLRALVILIWIAGCTKTEEVSFTETGFLCSFWSVDVDEDGYGDSSVQIQSCQRPEGYVALSGDCDDTDHRIHPAAGEICNGRDDDCNGQTDDNVQRPTGILSPTPCL